MARTNRFTSTAPQAGTDNPDQYTGVGGSYVINELGERVPSDPATGLPMTAPAPVDAQPTTE